MIINLETTESTMEKFYDIPGYAGLYAISKIGNIKAYKRTWVTGKNLVRNKEEQNLKLFIKRSGYYHIGLCKNGIMKQYRVHTLVALTFIPNPENKICINHKDGNKLNNNVENLEWVTFLENNIHALKTGLRINPSGKDNGYSVPVNVFKSGALIGRFDSLKDASVSNGIQYDKAYKISKGMVKKTEFRIERIL